MSELGETRTGIITHNDRQGYLQFRVFKIANDKDALELLEFCIQDVTIIDHVQCSEATYVYTRKFMALPDKLQRLKKKA